ncbi:PIN domain-containing protein [Candidatus Poribacteria bacterium]|nr:PIN domain-containing protein [Candidatus Poribacteria bacterium]MBM4307264.1 PIN domain-containing protein [Deltaproteobacteria bacterium]
MLFVNGNSGNLYKRLFILCVSRPILKEYFDVLGRFQFEREDFFGRLINAFERGPNILFIDNPKEENWIEGDPADIKFIACGISLHAEYIVSDDIHLKRAKKIGNVEIIPPREMHRLIEAG